MKLVRDVLSSSLRSLLSEGHTVVGIHYRGNDHAEELPGGKLIPLKVAYRHLPDLAVSQRLLCLAFYSCTS